MGRSSRCSSRKSPFRLLNRARWWVQVKAAGLCHTKLHFVSGLLDLGVQPVTLGHEVVGRVAQVGAGVTDLEEGQRVIVYYYVGCGRCRHCLTGDENLCGALQAEYGFVSDGGFAGALKVPAIIPSHQKRLAAAPDDRPCEPTRLAD